LQSLHPCPSHASIRALERDLFKKLETLQSTQSEEWGFRGLAKQPEKYALKSATPWVHSPNPGQHHPLGLAAGATRDAEAIYAAEKAAYQAQATVTRAIIAALNIAVPKAFRRGTNAGGGTIVGPQPTAAIMIPGPSYLLSRPLTAFHLWPNATPTKRSSRPRGTRPCPSRPTSIASRTAI
jgi:hypothetical protein